MPAAVETSQIFRVGQARVYTSPTLTTGDNWIQRPYLYCDSWRHVAGPDIGGGQLRFDYGAFDIRAADLFDGSRASGIDTPLDILRHYVKIEVLDSADLDDVANAEPQATYYGRVDAVENLSANNADGFSGTQLFTVYDLKVELADVVLRTSLVEKPDENASESMTIGQAIGFNISPQGARKHHGNHSSEYDTDGQEFTRSRFSWNPSVDDKGDTLFTAGVTPWNGALALRYLLENDVPKDKDGDTSVNWTSSNILSLAWYDIAIQREGRTALEVLNDIVDRRRLVGYVLECSEDTETSKFTINVRIFTFTDEEIDVPARNDNWNIEANEDTTTLVAQTSPATESIVLGEIATHQVDIVRVEGEPITSTFTLKYFNTTEEDELSLMELRRGWRTTDDPLTGTGGEDTYVAAAGSDEDANMMFRVQDKYETVFSKFVLADFWRQIATRQSDDDEFHVVIPVEDIPNDDIDDAEVEELFAKTDDSEGGPWWHRGHRFLPYLAVTNSDSAEYRPPFVLFQDSTTATVYRFAEKLNADGVYDFACHVHILQDRPGFLLRVNKYGGQQMIAKAAWAAGTPGATPTEIDPDSSPAVDYEDMLATVTMEWDDRAYAEEVIDDTRATLKVQLIRVPDARLDFELPGTVTDVDDAGALVESTGKVLRDDRERLRGIAKAASQWYGSKRRAARLTYSDTAPIVEVGQFITDLVIGATTEEINTPVTGVAYDFNGGRVFVETSYADADFA